VGCRASRRSIVATMHGSPHSPFPLAHSAIGPAELHTWCDNTNSPDIIAQALTGNSIRFARRTQAAVRPR
jgi:hypothetical protein